ncbi:MAG: pilus assembly protein CpaB [Clostridia bacterium]|nr:pilus assembly protein CpaB [Clostridia bacterium]
MKNRTVLGLLCMVLAVVITFAAAPLVSRVTTDTVSVVRLKTDVKQGTKITAEQIETVKTAKNALPSGAYSDSKQVVGRTAASNLYAGDYLTAVKLAGESKTADSVVSALDGTKFAMSFTIDSFAAGLSGKIKNGDIIRLVVMDKAGGRAIMPPEFQYCRVVTTTTAGGVDQDKIVKNEDGSFTPPATVTLLVNSVQARLLAEYEEYTINCILVYRGDKENAEKFLAVQDEYFKTGGGGANE